MRVADYIFKTLADRGVDTVFMVSGGGAMFLNDALGCEKRIRRICNHNEQGAAIAAEGYSRVTGKLGVVSVTTGPGGTNAITGLIGEWLDSQPVLYISGQVKMVTCASSYPEIPLRQLGDQEINIVDIVRPITKYAKMVTEPSRIRYELEAAISIAMSGRKGPVWLDIPINIQSAEIDENALPPYDGPQENIPAISSDQLLAVRDALLRAKAPVIVAGQGIRLADSITECRQLVERLNIPVVVTFNGFDMFPTDMPQMIGKVGTIGDRAGNFALQNADCVICIGTRNNIRQISYNYENFAKNAKDLLVVDIDQAELDKPTVRPTIKIHGDAGNFIRGLLACLDEKLPDWSKWLAWNQERKAKYPVVLDSYKDAQEGINPYLFTEILTRALPENAIVGCANATPSLGLFQAGIIKAGQRMMCNSGCAAMGYGLPAALGAAVAAMGTERTVVCLDGDGSIMMNLQELQTFTHYALPVKLFLYNNNEYCSIRQTQDNFFNGRHSGCDVQSGVSFPKWDAIAEAFGWEYVTIRTTQEAEQKIKDILTSDKAIFCDVRLTPGYTFSPKLSSRRLPDGSLVSPSLEDMFPFLDEKNIYEP